MKPFGFEGCNSDILPGRMRQLFYIFDIGSLNIVQQKNLIPVYETHFDFSAERGSISKY